MENNQKLNRKGRLKAHNEALEAWHKRSLLDVNSIPFDEVCADLIITNPNNNNANEPRCARIFNNQESINIGLFLIPDQFDETNTQEQFINNLKRFRNQFDTILFMNNDSNFSDFDFKEIVSNEEIKATTHYRNTAYDFEDFKNIFKPKSIVIMRTAIAAGSNSAMEAVHDAFVFPDFYVNQVLEMKNMIACIATGSIEFTEDEVNQIGLFCLNQNKRGASLCLRTIEDLSLLNEVRVTILISGFDITE